MIPEHLQPQYDAFLADIRANPEEDRYRLILADWLEEEAGDEVRAAWIRAQITLAALSPDGDHDEAWYAAQKVQDDILALGMLAAPWLDPWGDSPHDHWRAGEKCAPLLIRWPRTVDPVTTQETQGERVAYWHRGFVRSVECRIADWLETGANLLETQPLMGLSVTVTPANPEIINSSGQVWGIYSNLLRLCHDEPRIVCRLLAQTPTMLADPHCVRRVLPVGQYPQTNGDRP